MYPRFSREVSVRLPVLCLVLVSLWGSAPVLANCVPGQPGTVVIPNRLEINAQAALVGSCGLEVKMDGTIDNRWITTLVPLGVVDVYRASFRLHLNTFRFNGHDGTTNKHLIFAATAKNEQGQNEAAIRVHLRKRSGAFHVVATSQNTAGDNQRVTPTVLLENVAGCCRQHQVEVEWTAASAPGVGDGIIRVRVNGGPWAENTSVKSVGQTIINGRLGAFTGVDVQSTGSYFIDDFRSFRTLAPSP